jgi:hypothetical protein
MEVLNHLSPEIAVSLENAHRHRKEKACARDDSAVCEQSNAPPESVEYGQGHMRPVRQPVADRGTRVESV